MYQQSGIMEQRKKGTVHRSLASFLGRGKLQGIFYHFQQYSPKWWLNDMVIFHPMGSLFPYKNHPTHKTNPSLLRMKIPKKWFETTKHGGFYVGGRDTSFIFGWGLVPFPTKKRPPKSPTWKPSMSLSRLHGLRDEGGPKNQFYQWSYGAPSGAPFLRVYKGDFTPFR